MNLYVLEEAGISTHPMEEGKEVILLDLGVLPVDPDRNVKPESVIHRIVMDMDALIGLYEMLSEFLWGNQEEESN